MPTIDRNVAGPHVQSWNGDARDFARTTPMGSLKILNTALDVAAIMDAADRNTDMPVIFRSVRGDDLANLLTRTRQDAIDLRPLRARLGDRLFVEVSVNEAFQAGDDLNRLSDATIQAVAVLTGEGYRPIVGNFSVGNPQLLIALQRLHPMAPIPRKLMRALDHAQPAVKRPNLAYPVFVRPLAFASGARTLATMQGDWARFAPAVAAAIDARGALGLHEYSIPGERWLDGWLNGRYAHALDELAVLGLHPQVVIGEHGIDRGVLNGHLGGWRSPEFGLSPDGYASLLDRSFALYAADPRVLAVTVFGAGAYLEWGSFDYTTESAVRAVFSKRYRVEWQAPPDPDPTPPIVVTPPTPPDPAPSTEVPRMHKVCYLHQFDQLGERSIPEIAATLRLGGVSEIRIKSHQELTWIGNATTGDTSPLRIKNLADCQRVYGAFAAEGIKVVFWCVPMGTNVDQEVGRAADVAHVCGGVVELDAEPYTGFWEGPYNLLEPYTDGLQALGIAYDVNFDARPNGWHPFTVAQFSRVCRDARQVWTQSYWGTAGFGTADEVVTAALGVLDVLEVPATKRGIIFPSFGSADYAAMASKLDAHGVPNVGMWRMGDAGPATFAALAAIPESSTAPIVPDVDREALWNPVYNVARRFRDTGTRADLITANALDAAYQASKVMWGVDPRD